MVAIGRSVPEEPCPFADAGHHHVHASVAIEVPEGSAPMQTGLLEVAAGLRTDIDEPQAPQIGPRLRLPLGCCS